jgi:hypothetical protein
MSTENIGQKAQDLYTEHHAIVDRHNELAGRAIAKVFTRKADRIDGLLASGVIDEDRAQRMIVGRRLSSQIAKTETKYGENRDASEQHYATHKEAYHQMAVDEASAAGVEVNFGGDVATNVNKNPSLEGAVDQQHPPVEAPKS